MEKIFRTNNIQDARPFMKNWLYELVTQLAN